MRLTKRLRQDLVPGEATEVQAQSRSSRPMLLTTQAKKKKRESVLELQLAQLKANEQLYFPHDEKFLGEVPDVNLHLSLRSYLVRWALVEQEMFGRVEQVRACYLKLVEESEAQKANLERALLLLLTKEDELDNWHWEMEVRKNIFNRLKVEQLEVRAVGEGLVEQDGEGYAQDSWAISLERKKGGGSESEVQSTQVPYAAYASLLPSPGLGVDPNLAP
ncbi:uncharacterized protein A4U43_C07F21460 [Asparagus officinalis]|uniref:Uncharacterized protein n=1 Tax=Asparagus officinalis TaxID=4686 RepID=A0A5P1EDT0_ASPOF|nr:uncharacterized protein A4U43_C07F21460 [Asparagus officinalis]